MVIIPFLVFIGRACVIIAWRLLGCRSLRVFAYPPVSHYALVGLAIGRSLDVSVMRFVFFFLKELTFSRFKPRQ